MKKSLETYLRNTTIKIIVNRPLWTSKSNCKKWKTSMKKTKDKIKQKAYQRWNSCKSPKKNKSKKTWMTPTNSSINLKIKIPNKLPSTVTMMMISKISKTKRKMYIKMKPSNKCQEKCMGLKILKANPKIILKTKSNSSRRTSSTHFFWEIMFKNWRRALTCKISKISINPKEWTSNWTKSSLKWTEIFLTTLRLKTKLSFKISENSSKTNN